MKDTRLLKFLQEEPATLGDEQATLDAFSSTALTTALDTERVKRYKIENATLQEKLNTARQDREERKKYASSAFDLVAYYLAAVLIIELFCGGKIIHLEENVQLALIGTLATNVIGILLIVMRYLFSSKSEK